MDGGQTLITDNGDDAFCVIEGDVMVFMIPYNHGLAGKRLFLLETGKKRVIPSFCYRDEDYREWRFAIVARDHAKIVRMNHAATSVLKKKFLAQVLGENAADEQFETLLVDRYLTNCTREDAQIYKMRQETLKIRKQLRGKGTDENEEELGSVVWTNETYRAVSYLCNENNVVCADYPRIMEISGRQVGLSDVAKVSGFSYHVVNLKKGWWKQRTSPLIVQDGNGKIYALQPYAEGRYRIYDPDSGTINKLKKKKALEFVGRAYSIDWLLPAQLSDYSSAFSFVARGIYLSDCAKYVLLCAVEIALIFAVMVYLYGIINRKLLSDGSVIWGTCALSLCLVAVLAVNLIRKIVLLDAGTRIIESMQRALYDQIFHMPLSRFRQGLRNHMPQKVYQFGEAAYGGFFGAMSLAWELILGFSVLLLLSRLLGASTALLGLLFVFCSLMAILLAALRNKLKNKCSQERRSAQSQIRQMIHGIIKIRSCGSGERSIFEYITRHRKAEIWEAKNKKILNWLGTSFFYVSLPVFAFGLMKAGVVGWNGGTGILLLPSLCIFFLIYSCSIASSAGRCFRWISEWRELHSMLSFGTDADENELLKGKTIRRIEINDVHFRYQQDEPERIRGVSLIIQDGDYIGIVGKSGSGKSTLLKLLLGMERPTSGKIFYNNMDLDRLDRRTLRRSFGAVLQTEKLIPGSIYDNIALHDSKISQSELEKVLSMVGLGTELKSWPMGLHTQVSDTGEDLSTGQIQKILLARAILHRPGILFLDEVTSSLDDDSQSGIVECLQNMDATRIVISHRIQTLRGCDRILVMDEGRVIEDGSYEELMESKGIFYQMAEKFA